LHKCHLDKYPIDFSDLAFDISSQVLCRSQHLHDANSYQLSPIDDTIYDATAANLIILPHIVCAFFLQFRKTCHLNRTQRNIRSNASHPNASKHDLAPNNTQFLIGLVCHFGKAVLNMSERTINTNILGAFTFVITFVVTVQISWLLPV
jgi:hypothetical protein